MPASLSRSPICAEQPSRMRPRSLGVGTRVRVAWTLAALMLVLATKPGVTVALAADSTPAVRGAEHAKPSPSPQPESTHTVTPSGPVVNSSTLLRRVDVDALAGVAIPVSDDVRAHLNRDLFVGALGARITLGWLELAPRVVMVFGKHGTIFNEVEQPQEVLGGGAMLQVGAHVTLRSLRLIPGIEGGWLSLSRTIERQDHPFIGKLERQSAHLPIFGGFLRLEYVARILGRVAPAMELSGAWIPTEAAGGTNANFNLRVSGGLSYALR